MAKGGVTIPILLGICNGFESITSYAFDYEEKMYSLLENMYVVNFFVPLIGAQDNRTLKACLFLKTTLESSDKEFGDIVSDFISTNNNIQLVLEPDFTVNTSKCTFEGTKPATEKEMLMLMQQQILKFNFAGKS